MVLSKLYFSITGYFVVPDDAVDGDVIIYGTNQNSEEKSKNIGILDIYEPPVDCSVYGNAYYWDEKGECYCEWGYKWNSDKTECMENIKKIDDSGLINDSDNDGIPDEKDFYPYKKSNIITKKYSFHYKLPDGNKGKYISIDINVPNDLYLYYQNQNHKFSENYNNITSFITYNDSVIIDIANQIAEYKRDQGLNPVDLVYQLVGEIMYTEDKFSIIGWDEYPKYPIETIVERKGDCEDTTFLMASLLEALDLSIPMLVRFDNHIGVAAVVPKDTIDIVIEKWGEDFMLEFNKSLKEENPNDYYGLIYLETTGNAYWVPGYMPKELRVKNYEIHTIDEYKRYQNNSSSDNTSQNVITEEKSLITKIDEKLSKRMSGNILLQVEKNGEGWYVYPDNKKKYYLGRPTDAFSIMRKLGLGATHKFITENTIFPDRVLGKILLDVEQNGEAYYIYPKDKKAYYLGRPADAFSVMRNLGLGITNDDVRKIAVGEVE